MFLIVSEAQPAELVSALRAGHVHASLVFLNGGLALRAVFGVEFDPDIGIVHAGFDPIEPLDENVARNGSVRLLEALEAPVEAAVTHDVCLAHRGVLHGVGAARRRTPLGAFVQIDERLLEIVFVFAVEGWLAQLLEERFANDQFTATIGTGGVD